MTRKRSSKRPTTHRPCATCPWRKDVQLGYWHRDHFESIARTCHGDGLATMLCHKQNGAVCAGWAAVEGFDAIGLRLAALRGEFDRDKLDVDGLELYASMAEMIRANNRVYAAQNQAIVSLGVLRRRYERQPEDDQ